LIKLRVSPKNGNSSRKLLEFIRKLRVSTKNEIFLKLIKKLRVSTKNEDSSRKIDGKLRVSTKNGNSSRKFD
jgi:hypothetical protein